MKKYYVYILKCNDGSYYTGITNDLVRRLKEHERGNKEFSYTASRLPVELVYCSIFSNVCKAIEREKQLKKWTRRKKEALIAGNISLLKEFATGEKALLSALKAYERWMSD